MRAALALVMSGCPTTCRRPLDLFRMDKRRATALNIGKATRPNIFHDVKKRRGELLTREFGHTSNAARNDTRADRRCVWSYLRRPSPGSFTPPGISRPVLVRHSGHVGA